VVWKRSAAYFGVCNSEDDAHSSAPGETFRSSARFNAASLKRAKTTIVGVNTAAAHRATGIHMVAPTLGRPENERRRPGRVPGKTSRIAGQTGIVPSRRTKPRGCLKPLIKLNSIGCSAAWSLLRCVPKGLSACQIFWRSACRRHCYRVHALFG
jgi:hypothetical protein